jgi:hypothetical protein
LRFDLHTLHLRTAKTKEWQASLDLKSKIKETVRERDQEMPDQM